MTKKINILFHSLLLISFLAFVNTSCTNKSETKTNYESVENDPMKMRIYTLDNGLKIYMSVYKDAPRIQTAIAVKTGSKNDPSDNTGMSHYLEHMMFKGTHKFGTKNYAMEAPLLRQIDSLFEVYRKLTDKNQRIKEYHIIDSISSLASKYAIANEYDKMMSGIGASGTNAFTSMEQTVYINDIPSNQLSNWLDIEYERFYEPDFRLFHTELETVYEEKNMSLDRDEDKEWDALLLGLFPTHTYGTQTTIGKVEHLKNPSLKSLKEYYNSRYVPNNMAIIIAGDFDPDSAYKTINEKFGKLKSKEIKPFVPAVEKPILKPVITEVFGPDAEDLVFGYRFGGATTKDPDMLQIINKILYNGTAGLIDLNLKQQQKVLEAYSFVWDLQDYSVHILSGKPKSGQKLEEVKDQILSQIELIKKGEFPDWLLTAIINNIKIEKTKALENNWSRVSVAMNSFIKNTPWSDDVTEIDRLTKITKKDVVKFANDNYKDNYVVIYKRTGKSKDVIKVEKPKITPVNVNREDQSAFVKDILNRKTKPIEPVFLDFSKDLNVFNAKSNIEVLYKENTENDLFDLYYVFEMGTNNNNKLSIATKYLEYLGTSKYNPAQFKQELYKIGASFDVYCSNERVWIMLSGLNENFNKGIELFESLLADAQPNADALKNLIKDILKQRQDDKLSKETILWSAMNNYGVYGPKSPFTSRISEEELNSLKPEDLISIIKELNSFKHKVMYYGKMNQNELTSTIDKYHKVPATLKDLPKEIKYEELDNNENKVFIVDYDMKQVELLGLSKSELFNKDNVAIREVFNEYFGGGMGSIVFQELRESKALAYSAYAEYSTPNKLDRHHYLLSYIGTQNDKLPEAMSGMTGLFNNMPESEKCFKLAKDAIIARLRTERITKSDILFEYWYNKIMGIDHDNRKDIWDQVPKMKFADLKNFQLKYIKDKKFTTLVLGNKKQLDTKTLEKYGKIQNLTLKDVFGY